MKEFDSLLKVLNQLLAENGCPWDRKQTIQSLRPYLIEEAHEMVDAIDSEIVPKMVEEAGDLLHTIVFISKVAQRDKIFTLEEVVKGIREKLIRRHPHIFGNEKAKDEKEVEKIWKEVKAQEKSDSEKVLESLPTLERARKILKRKKPSLPAIEDIENEEDFGWKILELIEKGEKLGLNANLALNKILGKIEAGDLPKA